MRRLWLAPHSYHSSCITITLLVPCVTVSCPACAPAAEHPPDIDATNKKGQSISQLVDELLGSGAPKASTQAHQRADSESESEGAAWRRRLAEEAG